jgi:chemotaxis signal transduction protein
MTSQTSSVTIPQAMAAVPNGHTEMLLIVRLGGRRFAIPLAAIGRILPMAALTPLPGAPRGIAGVLSLQGTALPVVDPRPRLDVDRVSPQPGQHLVAIVARTRYLLWIDRAEEILAAPTAAIGDVLGDAPLIAPRLARVGQDHLLVLSPADLDPGPVFDSTARPR